MVMVPVPEPGNVSEPATGANTGRVPEGLVNEKLKVPVTSLNSRSTLSASAMLRVFATESYM